MNIPDLISLAENKLTSLNCEMSNAVQRGDVDVIARIEAQAAETQATLDALRAIA